MKKLLVAMILLSGVSVVAEDGCLGGSFVTGNNGTKYCVSTKTMNWFTAFSWCESQGMHLATLDKICNTETETWVEKCPNFLNSTQPIGGWSSTPVGASHMFVVSSPAIVERTKELDYHAICVQ